MSEQHVHELGEVHVTRAVLEDLLREGKLLGRAGLLVELRAKGVTVLFPSESNRTRWDGADFFQELGMEPNKRYLLVALPAEEASDG